METDAESELLQADHGVSAEIMLSDEEGYGASQTTAGATVIRTCLKQSKPSKRISNPATFRVGVTGLTEGDILHACPMNSIRGSPTSSQHAYFCIGPFGRLRRGELPQKMSPIIATQSTEEIDIALVFDGDKQEKERRPTAGDHFSDQSLKLRKAEDIRRVGLGLASSPRGALG